MSTSVINSAIFWDSIGYNVHIYCEKPDLIRFPLPVFPEKNIKFIISEISNKAIIDDIVFRFKYFTNNKYEWVIGFDNGGVIRGGISTVFTKCKLIYHSLEFYEPVNRSLKHKIIKLIEIIFSFKARFIFSQDTYRIKFLKNDLYQRNSKFRIIYNSPSNVKLDIRPNYFRNLFKISEDKIIVLCVGSLIKEHYVKELINSINTWSDQFILILHGWFPDDELKQYILNMQERFPNKLFISEKFLSDNEKHIPFQSCDIGFVGFKPVTNNLKFAAGSAGKIFDFMGAGKPVLAFNTPGMKEIIELNNVGKTFDLSNQIYPTLLNILDNYKEYSSNTIKVMNDYDFFKQYSKVYKDINIIIS